MTCVLFCVYTEYVYMYTYVGVHARVWLCECDEEATHVKKKMSSIETECQEDKAVFGVVRFPREKEKCCSGPKVVLRVRWMQSVRLIPS